MAYRIVIRNFCVALVSNMQSKLREVEDIWKTQLQRDADDMDPAIPGIVFVKLMNHVALWGSDTVNLFLPEWQALALAERQAQPMSSPHMNNASSPRHSQKVIAENIENENYFATEETLETCLWELFNSIDLQKRGLITFTEYHRFTIDGAVRGKDIVQEKEIKAYSVVKEEACGVLYRMQLMQYIEELRMFLVLVQLKDGNLRLPNHPEEIR
eukprot:PhF_6_TR10396/c0_g1_i1/m.16276